MKELIEAGIANNPNAKVVRMNLDMLKQMRAEGLTEINHALQFEQVKGTLIRIEIIPGLPDGKIIME